MGLVKAGESMAQDVKQSETVWTATQRKYIEWLSMSSFDRTPLTKEGFAKANNVGKVTLWRWEKIPGFMDEVRRLITASLGDVYHDVMHSFKQEATKGSYQHQRTYFEMLGVYTPRTQTEIGGIGGGPVRYVEIVPPTDAENDSDD